MIQIKICGITRAEDAILAAAAGADALGLNYFSGSNRRLAPGAAKQRLLESWPANVARVGLFVDSSAREIVAAAAADRLDWIQLHGNESPELLAELRTMLPNTAVIRAFRMGSAGLSEASEHLDRCRQLNALPAAVLIDADAAGQFGGTGQTVDWQRLARERALLGELPLILAGGLTAANVGEAIRAVRPDAVDTASGVEISPGIKDPTKTRAFIQAAAAAFAEHG